jgi:O-antigen/teichoic acid export membrane protein
MKSTDTPAEPQGPATGTPGLAQHAVSGMAWVAWGSGAVALLKVAVLVLLTRLLTPADFGVVSAALVVISFALNFSQLGLGPAIVQRPVLEPRHISTAFAASLGFGFLVAAAVWAGAPAIAHFFRMDHLVPVVRVLAFIFPIAGLSSVPESLLQRDLRFRILANRNVLAYGVGYGLIGLGLALAGAGVWALVAAQLSQVALLAIIVWRAAPPMLSARPTWASLVELLEYGVGQSASRIAVIVAGQGDNLVVGRWLGAVALGYYSRAYQLMSVPTMLLGDVLDKVLFPTMSRIQKEPRRLASAYLQGTASVALVTLPVGVAAAVLAPELVLVAFGGRWQGLVAPFQVLALGMTFRASYRMSDALTRATGKVYRRAWRQGVFAGVVVLGAWLGQHHGLIGVATGVLGALFLNYLMMAHLSLAVVELSWSRFARAQLPAVRLAVMVGATSLATIMGTRHLGLPPLAGLVAGSVVATGTAILAAWQVPAFALGEHGIRTRDTLLTYAAARLQPLRVRFSR